MQNHSVDTPNTETVAPGEPFPAVPLTAITAEKLPGGLEHGGKVAIGGDEIFICLADDTNPDARKIAQAEAGDLTAHFAIVRRSFAEQDKADLFAEFIAQKKATAKPRFAAQPAGVIPVNPEITVAENMVLHCARQWRQAETDGALYAELNAWDAMRVYVNEYRAGRFSHTEAQEVMGYHDEAVSMAFYNAVVTIAGLVHLFDDDYDATAVPAEGSERQ